MKVDSHDLHDTDKDLTDGISTVSYSRGDDQRQRLEPGYMWRPAGIANSKAWEDIARKVQLATGKVRSGKRSCLSYYMAVNHMNVLLLAMSAHIPFPVVYLHTLPFFFRRASAKNLQKYAQLFDVSSDDLRTGRLLQPVYGVQEE